jgi:flavin reductase
MQTVDESVAFKDAMSALASGVVLVTCSVAGRTWGTTVTSFTSVAADPPTVLVSLRSDSTAAAAIDASMRYGVVVLAPEHEELARACSIPGALKFVEVDETPARLECVVVRTVRIADHTVFFGRVVAAHAAGDEAEPLLDHRRRSVGPSS